MIATVGQPYRQHCRLGGNHGLEGGVGGCRPCSGQLRFADVRGPVPLVKCDRCGYETGVLR